jgi:hypothetical protein
VLRRPIETTVVLGRSWTGQDVAIVETQTDCTAESEDARKHLHSPFARDHLVGADFLSPRQE